MAADLPPACAASEPYEFCGLVVQRNNALNDLVRAQAEANRLGDRIAQITDYWKRYLEGEEAQRQQAAKAADERVARAAEAARRH